MTLGVLLGEGFKLVASITSDRFCVSVASLKSIVFQLVQPDIWPMNVCMKFLLIRR